MKESGDDWADEVEQPLDDWARVADFYHRSIGYGWCQGRMLKFVTWLAAGPYRRLLFPSTSLNALGLSTVATYQERVRRPMVYVAYSEPGGFVLHWQRGQGDEGREEPVQSPQAPEVFERILHWLGVTGQIQADPGSVLSRGETRGSSGGRGSAGEPRPAGGDAESADPSAG